MNTDAPPTMIDVSGLPEAVVHNLQQLVQSLRNTHAPASTAPRTSWMGRFAETGKSITKEEIDAAQHDLWANFPQHIATPETP